MKLSKVASILKAKNNYPDIEISSVETDTRTLKANSLFVALKGDQFDGHDFAADAEKKGASCILADREIKTSLPVIQVKDTLEALGILAASHRETFQIPVIGLTGSCGKTTTKALIARILEQVGTTLSTEGTLNNHIGVPLMLTRLNHQHQYAVIEMGANHPGEIAYLTQMVKPTAALITNIAPVHLEGFGSLEGVSRSKSEIFQGLAPEGIAIINADEPSSNHWRELVSQNTILDFGLKSKAQILAKNITLNSKSQPNFLLVTPQGEIPIELKLIGEHQVMNALAASACAYSQKISLEQIKAGLESLEEVNRRLCSYQTPQGASVIDDSYNANPASTLAALQVLKKASAHRIFVFADMLELGHEAEAYHQAIGKAAKSLGIERILTFGHLAKQACEAFGENSAHFNDKKQLISALIDLLDEETTVLVKGSNGMKMWEIVQAISNSK